MKIIAKISTLAIAVAAFGTSVAAQNAIPDDRVVSVYERSRPDYSAPGVRSGSFLFNPSIEGGARYNSNIFARREGPTAFSPGEVDDLIWTVKPGLTLNSDWNQHFFGFFANADIARYTDNSNENYEDFNVGADGRIDVSRGTALNFGLSFSDLHEDRGSPDTNGLQAEQTRFEQFTAKAGFKRDLALVSLAIDGSYQDLDFTDPDLVGGGVLNNSDRNRERYSGSVRVGYEIDEFYEAFIRLRANRVEYEDSTVDGGPQRNSDGYEIVGGATFDITGSSQGEFYVGYVKQSYDSNSLSNIDDFTFGASLLWNPSGLTSVRASIDRTVQESAIFDLDEQGLNAAVSGILSTAYAVDVEHELQRNVLLKATASYTSQDYENTVREDDVYRASFGGQYLLNRNLALDASYTWDYRNTTTAGQDYKRHVVSLTLKARW